MNPLTIRNLSDRTIRLKIGGTVIKIREGQTWLYWPELEWFKRRKWTQAQIGRAYMRLVNPPRRNRW